MDKLRMQTANKADENFRKLAAMFGVSRQVIVQDMAVIRASTPGILSTTRGYVLPGLKWCKETCFLQLFSDQIQPFLAGCFYQMIVIPGSSTA